MSKFECSECNEHTDNDSLVCLSCAARGRTNGRLADVIVREFAEKSPIDIDNDMGAIVKYCRYCGARVEYEEHGERCLWIRARRYAGKEGA